MASTLRPFGRRLSVPLACAAFAAVSLSACGGSGSPVSGGGGGGGGTTTTTAASTTTTTASTTTTTASTTTTTTTPATTTTTTGGSSPTTVTKAQAQAFCRAAAGRAQSLIRDGHAVAGYKGGKPTQAIVKDVAALAADFKALEPAAPGAIKHYITVAAEQYGNLARALATGDTSKIDSAFSDFMRSGVINDLLKVETFERQHCL